VGLDKASPAKNDHSAALSRDSFVAGDAAEVATIGVVVAEPTWASVVEDWRLEFCKDDEAEGQRQETMAKAAANATLIFLLRPRLNGAGGSEERTVKALFRIMKNTAVLRSCLRSLSWSS
jgi:hypothetical protein